MPTTRTLTVALVGNPNTGKSTLFNALSGLRQKVGNYPGVTVEMKKGRTFLGEVPIELIDLPGTYSLAARSLDEMVAVDLLLGHQPGEARPDAIVSIVDATNLERHLYLTSQLLELGIPVILAITMLDLAEQQGVQLDLAKLEQRLGIPVVPIQPQRGQGLDRLRETILKAVDPPVLPQPPLFPEAFAQAVESLREHLPGDLEAFLARRLVLDVGGYTEERLTQKYGVNVRSQIEQTRQQLAEAGCAVPAVEARTRFGWIRQVLADCVQRPEQPSDTRQAWLDRVLIHRIWGTAIFLGVMFLVFQTIFTWAGPLMDAIDAGKDWLASQVESAMNPGPFRSLIVDGVLNGVGGVLIFLPQIMLLFGLIAILEDCGYMARAAFLMDRIMARCGLNGKSFIPLLSSVACAVPGVMATRVIENRRDRLATILVAPLMSCSARLPVYLLLIAAFLSEPWWLPGLVLFGMYCVGLVTAPLVALLLKRTLLRGSTPVFVMEMPAFRWPTLRSVARRMLDAGGAFVSRAGTLILASMVLVWALLYFPTTAPNGRSYAAMSQQQSEQIDALSERLETVPQDDAATRQALTAKRLAAQAHRAELQGAWRRQSWLGQAGQALEPVFAPLGWDWKIGMAALASFPAREVVVGTLGIIYNQGDVDPGAVEDPQDPEGSALKQALRTNWAAHPLFGAYRVPTAVSLMVFFALCCQCVSTLAVIRRETKSWSWPLFTFTYMTVLAYVAALAVFQIGRLIVDLNP